MILMLMLMTKTKPTMNKLIFLMPHRMAIRCPIIFFLGGDGFDDSHANSDADENDKDKANDE